MAAGAARLGRLVLCVLASLGLRAARADDAPAPKPPLTRIQQFWDLLPGEKARPVAFRIECDVTYYDPDWKLLFVQDTEGDGAYVPSSNLEFTFRTGQHLLTVGQFVPPNYDVTFDHALISQVGLSKAVPTPVGSALERWELFNNKLVSLDGLVDRSIRYDLTHVKLMMSVQGRSVVGWIPVLPRTTVPDFDNSVVRVEGVYNPKEGPDGKLSWLELMVPDADHVHIVNRLENDARFTAPVVPISSLPSAPPDRIVHVVGKMKAQDPGKLVRIRDESGQVDVLSGQMRACAVDDTVEAVGYPVIKGTTWQLADGVYRIEGAPAARPKAEAADDVLRIAGQVMELEPEEASKGRSVAIVGVVTWCDATTPYFYVQDSSGGICIKSTLAQAAQMYAGANVSVSGVTGMGRYAPVVEAVSFTKVSDVVLPVAEPITLERAMTGGDEGNWVEMNGYLRKATRRGHSVEMELVTSSGDFQALVPREAEISPLVGGFVRLQGVCTALTTGEGKLVGIRLLVPTEDYVQAVQPPPKSPFDVPVRALTSLGRFNSAQSYNRLLQVSGTVLFDSPGHFVQIEDKGETLQVFSMCEVPVKPGDRIDAVGILSREGARISLREAVYRVTGHPGEPQASPIEVRAGASEAYDGRLVTLRAVLIDSSTTAGQLRLTLQSEKVVFEAFLDTAGLEAGRLDLTEGSQLSLTGLYQTRDDEFGKPAGFHMDLRSPSDIAVLSRPTWFTRTRILGVAGALSAGIVLFIAWVAVLRRRVSEQTEQIREQLRRESRLEAELLRASKLESLGLLAGGIAHDFNNLLTVVMGNLSLARMEEGLGPEATSSLEDAEKAASRARDLTQQLLTFAKGGTPIQTAVLLPDVVREVAEFALRGSKVRCQFDIPEGLWPANVDKGQIGQVVQNIVINAMQAMPEGGIVDVAIRNQTVGVELGQVLEQGRYLQLSFTDHGVGIGPRDVERVFDPYFTTKKGGSGLGLATVHSIVKKHKGHISVESTVGRGTTFRIWLPAAQGQPGAGAAASPQAAKIEASAGARILFMDDEASIRKVGALILSRAGNDVTSVADGAEALAEYESALKQGRPYALVILDLTIPGGMGGTQTLEQLLKIDPGVKAIVCSGYSNDAVLSDYRAYGFKGMVSKPYEAADLVVAVERVLRGGLA